MKLSYVSRNDTGLPRTRWKATSDVTTELVDRNILLSFIFVSINESPFISFLYLQLEAEVFNPPDIFPLIPIVNKSCNIERCVKNMLQIFQNMMVSQYSKPELNMFRGTTLSDKHLLIYVWVQNLQKYSTPWSHWYVISLWCGNTQALVIIAVLPVPRHLP